MSFHLQPFNIGYTKLQKEKEARSGFRFFDIVEPTMSYEYRLVPQTLKSTIGIPFIVHSEILDTSTNVVSKALNIPVVHTDLVDTIGVPIDLSLTDVIRESRKLG